MRESNMYSGSIFYNSIPAVYFVVTEQMDAIEHYGSPYLLRVYGKYNGVVSIEDEGSVVHTKEMQLIFIEEVECSLTDWAKNNILIQTPQRLTTLVSTPPRLTPLFREILL